jgi:iron complex outermembrane recepter protein
MTPSKHRFWRAPLWALAVVLTAVGVNQAAAQAVASGSISGRIFNPRSGEYVRDAEVSVVGSTAATVSGTSGVYRLGNVPAGNVEVLVNYAGMPPTRVTAVVTAGATTTLDIQLGSSSTAKAGEDGVIQMEKFVVAAEVEGNAKALQRQRNSMDLGMSIASDVFGDVTEGNVGEFLKYLPGIEMEYVEADTRGPRLGGLNPEYTGVSVDGMKSASADGFMQYGSTENGSSGVGGRSFSFEQVSINSIESIEISRITPANLDADAPAGTINLKTKRAFDRKGRLVKWSFGAGLNSEEFTLKATTGPGDSGKSHKLKPSYSFNFADSFLNNRLGVLLGVSVSNLYNEQYRSEHTYQRTPIAADPRPQVLTQLRFKDGPKWTNRTTYTCTVDFKATENLMFSLSAVLNGYEANFWNRNVDFRASANSTSGTNGRQFAGGDGLTTFSTNSTSAGTASNRFVAISGGSVTKETEGYTFSPKFEWRLGDLLVEGRLSTSKSDNSYASLRDGRAGFGQVNNLGNVQFTDTRPDQLSGAWSVVQTGGADWADLANYLNPRMTDDVRNVTDEVNIAALDFTYSLRTRQPVLLRAGLKVREQLTSTDRKSDISRWNYIGPGGGPTGSWAALPSSFTHDPAALGVSYQSISGRGAPPFADTRAIGQLFLDNPSFFQQSFTADQYYNATYGDVRRFQEDVTAAYLMADTRFGRLSVQGGLRWEDTETTSREFDPRPASEVVAAGFTVNTTGAAVGRANTVAGLDYQYGSKPKVERKGAYDRLFPSLSLKYRLGNNWIIDAGAGHTIRRPEVVKLVGVYAINENTETITAANPGLLPEYADRVATSIAYYFGGTNNVTLTLSDTRIENLFINDEFTAEEFGIDDQQYADYIVNTFRNSNDGVRFRSLELAYRQRLDFLPGLLRGTSVFANYTRAYADRRRPGITPHVVTGGFDWRHKRLGFGLKGVWVDDAPWTSTEGRFRKSNLKLDGNIEYRITDRLTAYVQARNITNENHVVYEAIGGNVPVAWRVENYGANYVFGIRGQL